MGRKKGGKNKGKNVPLSEESRKKVEKELQANQDYITKLENKISELEAKNG